MTISDRIRFVRKFFGNTSLARDGANVAVKCPACGTGEKKKFSIKQKEFFFPAVFFLQE